jgi:hypothetical protein
MGTAVKAVLGGVSLVAIWLVLAVTVFSGTGSVEPRPDRHPGIVDSVETTGGTADPTLDPRP